MKLPNILRNKAAPWIAAGVLGLGGIAGGYGLYSLGSSSAEEELSRKYKAEIIQVRDQLNQLNQRNSDIVEQLRKINNPEYGQLSFKDGANQSVQLNITPGRDFEGESLQITRNGEKIATIPSASTTFVDSNGVEDGNRYAYAISGLVPGDIETGSRFGGNFVPFDEAFDYQLNINAGDKPFDQTRRIVVTPSFERYAAGDSVKSATFRVRSLADSSVVDSLRFTDLAKALEGFELNAGNDSLVVEGVLDLARGGNRSSISDTLIALDDMPQLVLEPVDGRKTIQGYQLVTTNFNDKAQADSLVSKLSGNPNLGGRNTVWVDYEGSNANDLVGRWLLPNESVVKTQEEAFRVKPGAAAVDTTAKKPGVYNGNYTFYDLDYLDGSGEEAFKLKPGNTVAGGLAEIAKRHGVSLSNEKLRDLSTRVNVHEGKTGNPIRNPNFNRLPTGASIHLTPEVRDVLYGTPATTVVTGGVANAEPSLKYEGLTTADLTGDGVIDAADYGRFLDNYRDLEAARVLSPITTEDGVEPNVFDFYALVKTLENEDLLADNELIIKPGYERWRSGDFDAVVPTTKSAGILRNAITLSPMFSNYGPGVSTSYDRLLGDGIVGIGATAGYNGEDPFWTGRVTLGNDRARAGLGLGQTYTEDKKAVTLEIPLQYNLDEKAYVELTPGIRDMGRWKGQLDGNGFEGTKDYGQVRVGAGFRFFRF